MPVPEMLGIISQRPDGGYSEYNGEIIAALLQPLTEVNPNLAVILLDQTTSKRQLCAELLTVTDSTTPSRTPSNQIIISVPSVDHFCGLYLTRNESGDYTATYISPTGDSIDPQSPLAQAISPFIEGNIRYSSTRLQYENNHGGAFTSFILAELALGRTTLVPRAILMELEPGGATLTPGYDSDQVMLQGYERDMPNISGDVVGKEASDKIGASIRALHAAQISGMEIEEIESLYEAIGESMDRSDEPPAKKAPVDASRQADANAGDMEVDDAEVRVATARAAPDSTHASLRGRESARESSSDRSPHSGTSAVSVLTAKEDIRIAHRVLLIPTGDGARPKVKAEFAISTSERTHVAITTSTGVVNNPTKTQGDHVSAYAAIVEMLCTVLAGSDIIEAVDRLKKVGAILLDDPTKFNQIVDKAAGEYKELVRHAHLPVKLDASGKPLLDESQNPIVDKEHPSYTAAKMGRVSLMTQFIEKSANGLLESVNIDKAIAFAKQGRRDAQEGPRVDNATHALEALKAMEDLRKVLFGADGRAKVLSDLTPDNRKDIVRFIEKYQKPRSAIRSGLGQLGSIDGKDKLKTVTSDHPKPADLSDKNLEELRGVIQDYDAQTSCAVQRPRRGAHATQAALTPEERKSQLIVSKIGDLFDFSCAKRGKDADAPKVLSQVTMRHLAICFVAFKLDKLPEGLQSAIVEDFVDDVVMGGPIAKKVGVTPGFHGQDWEKYKAKGKVIDSEELKTSIKTFLKSKDLMKEKPLVITASAGAPTVASERPSSAPAPASVAVRLMEEGRVLGS